MTKADKVSDLGSPMTTGRRARCLQDLYENLIVCYNSGGIVICGRKASMSKQEILAVEDDENILELVKYNLVTTFTV